MTIESEVLLALPAASYAELRAKLGRRWSPGELAKALHALERAGSIVRRPNSAFRVRNFSLSGAARAHAAARERRGRVLGYNASHITPSQGSNLIDKYLAKKMPYLDESASHVVRCQVPVSTKLIGQIREAELISELTNGGPGFECDLARRMQLEQGNQVGRILKRLRARGIVQLGPRGWELVKPLDAAESV